MRLMKRASLAAVAALALGAGAFVAAPAYAAPVSAVIGGITYEADDTNIAAGATATAFDASTTTVTIPNTVEIGGTEYDVVEIGGSAFATEFPVGTYARGEITAVVIGDNVRTVGLDAFITNKIDSLTLGASVEKIKGSAFLDNLLTHVTFPAAVTTIGGAAFLENTGLTSVTFEGPAPTAKEAGSGEYMRTFDPSVPGFMINFLEEYGVDHVTDGFTTPEWKGYPSQAIGDDEPTEYVSITKTVDATFVRVYDWELEKTGTVGEITVGDDGASADVDFTVTATPNRYIDGYYLLSGHITVTNEIVEPMSVTVTDEASIGVDSSCTIVTSEGEPVGDLRLDASESVVLDYYCDLDGTPVDGTNTATVSWGGDESSSVTEDVVFTQRDTSFNTITVGDDHANPDDGYTELGTATWNSDHMPTTFDYTLTAENLPLGECTTLTNTAMIYEMEWTTEATVEVCPEAAVITPDPTPTPTPTPDPVALASTGVDIEGGFLAIALLLMLAGGATMLSTRRPRRNLR